MVLFGIENRIQTCSTTETYLVITTNEITNEILNSVDTRTRNIIFQIPLNNASIIFDLKAHISTWNRFVSNIKHLEFRGKLVNNQWNVQHFECMTSMSSLYIGSTDYALFDNEDVSKLPMIPYILLNGYGLVQCSENMEKWLEKLKLNNCICEKCY